MHSHQGMLLMHKLSPNELLFCRGSFPMRLREECVTKLSKNNIIDQKNKSTMLLKKNGTLLLGSLPAWKHRKVYIILRLCVHRNATKASSLWVSLLQKWPHWDPSVLHMSVLSLKEINYMHLHPTSCSTLAPSCSSATTAPHNKLSLR